MRERLEADLRVTPVLDLGRRIHERLFLQLDACLCLQERLQQLIVRLEGLVLRQRGRR